MLICIRSQSISGYEGPNFTLGGKKGTKLINLFLKATLESRKNSYLVSVVVHYATATGQFKEVILDNFFKFRHLEAVDIFVKHFF